jgi:hypothetical protein
LTGYKKNLTSSLNKLPFDIRYDIYQKLDGRDLFNLFVAYRNEEVLMMINKFLEKHKSKGPICAVGMDWIHDAVHGVTMKRYLTELMEIWLENFLVKYEFYIITEEMQIRIVYMILRDNEITIKVELWLVGSYAHQVLYYNDFNECLKDIFIMKGVTHVKSVRVGCITFEASVLQELMLKIDKYANRNFLKRNKDFNIMRADIICIEPLLPDVEFDVLARTKKAYDRIIESGDDVILMKDVDAHGNLMPIVTYDLRILSNAQNLRNKGLRVVFLDEYLLRMLQKVAIRKYPTFRWYF